MNRQTILIIVGVVALVHVVFFYLATRTPARPKTKSVLRPNFNVSEKAYTDAETGEKFTYREISVSTKLIDPEVLKKLEAQRDANARAAATPAPTP